MIRRRFLILGSVLFIISILSEVERRNQSAPGIMYVSDRNADSICDTALLFLVMKSEYMPSHLVGCDRTSVALCVASLIIFVLAPISGWVSR